MDNHRAKDPGPKRLLKKSSLGQAGTLTLWVVRSTTPIHRIVYNVKEPANVGS